MNTTETTQTRLLITGGCGRIGSYFAARAPERYRLRIIDRVPWDADKLGPLRGECMTGSLDDLETCRRACAGMDMVVHLAADADPGADFYGSLLANNFIATYNMFQAAHEAGCKRFIFASSVHTVASYPRDEQAGERVPVRPTSMYGVSKCFGEAVAAHYGINLGMPSIAIRIGAYLTPEQLVTHAPEDADAFLHPDDFNHLLVQCLETPGIQFAIAHGISDNRYKRISLIETRERFNYHPQADGFAVLEAAARGG